MNEMQDHEQKKLGYAEVKILQKHKNEILPLKV
jgi:hypothetical protein